MGNVVCVVVIRRKVYFLCTECVDIKQHRTWFSSRDGDEARKRSLS